MAQVRARRPDRRSGPPRAPAPPPPRKPMPRLAALKMAHGRSARARAGRGGIALAAASLALITVAAIVGASALGDGLFKPSEALARAADAAALSAGLAVDDIEITGVAGARKDEVRAALGAGEASLFALDPQLVRARVESLDWVERASVRRLWPASLRVHVTRREAFARWQENGQISVIDANGERLMAARARDYRGLPLVVGVGAGPAAEPLLAALENMPAVRARLKAMVRVGARRWDIQLVNGAVIALPETAPERALAEIERLHAAYRLLDRPVARLDMRASGRLVVRVAPKLDGGPGAVVGGA